MRFKKNPSSKEVGEFEEYLCILYLIRKDEACLEKMEKIIQDKNWKKKISAGLMLNQMEYEKIRELKLSSWKRRREKTRFY